MKNLFALTLCLILPFWGFTQIASKLQASSFDRAYLLNPTIPQGLLEAVAYSKTRLQHINPQNIPEGCSGLPLFTGTMGLIHDGKGYFKNTLDLVVAKSGYSKKQVALNEDDHILAYAAAFSQLQNDLGIVSNGLEANIPVLRFLSELPTQTGGQLYAQDAEIYQILHYLEDQEFMQGVHRTPFSVNYKAIFGQNNYQVLSSKKISYTKNGISNAQNKTYQPNNQLVCIDYPGAIWVAADASNYSSRGGTSVSAVTIHTIQGSYAGAISWFQNPSANVSAHYVLRSSDGQVTQMVCETDKGWHVGTENPYTIGLEHEGFVNNAAWYTVAMYTSSANVCRDIVNSGYGINPLRTAFWPWTATTFYNQSGIPGSCIKIKGHMHYPNQTHTDPGVNWDWDYFYKLINDPPPTTSITTCTGSFTDSGGSSANYGDDERNLTVIEPTNASSVTLTFSSFDLELNWDYIYIYDGNSVWSPLIGIYTGTNNPGTVTSSGGALAIEFRSDCATNNAGWQATWTCSTVLTPPANLQVSVPACANSSYAATLSWDNADSNWYADISTDPGFTDFWNKPVPWLTTTTAPTGFLDPFALGALTLEPDTTYYWRIWDGSAWVNGPSFMVPFCPDTTAPTTSISNPNLWETSDFTATFTDADAGGAGIDLSFYQVLDFDGTEWRANNGNGFFNDNFDVAIHSDWSIATGTWAINGGVINQSNEAVNQTNMNAPLTQVNTEIYLYHWQANTLSGGSTNRRQGIHFYADNAGLPNGGNSYFVYFRANSNRCQIYKVVADVWILEEDTGLVVNENTWYDHKILFNPSTGEIKVYMDDLLVAEWTDGSPHTTGSGIFLRSGNADVLFNDLKVYRARTGSEVVTIGPGATNDVRFQNPNPTTPSCRIKSLVKDNAENWSTLGTLDVHIDWTSPLDVTVSDGTGADVDTICSLTELSANWSTSVDTHSDLTRYWYAIGTTPGGTDIINWLDNGMNTSVTQTGLTLQADSIYFFTIRVENGAGLFSNAISSDGQVPKVLQIAATVDTTLLTLPDSVVVYSDATPNAVSWNWSFPGGSPSSSTSQSQAVVYNTAGSYDATLTVSDVYGCTASFTETAYIVVSDPPPAPTVAGFTSNVISGCEPLTVSFTDASSNVPTSWLWLVPGGDTTASTDQNPVITYLNPGTYSVTLIATNFFGIDTLVMPNYVTIYANPVISVSADQSICEGETATLSAFGANTYLWNTGQTDSVISVSPLSTTTYTVTGFSNGCVSQQENVTVSVTTIPTTSITPDQNICFGDSLVITATGGNAYSWNTGATTASITVGSSTPPATYTVVISKDACADFDTSSTTVITVQKSIADFTASDTLVELQNATISFSNTSSSASVFDWDLGDGNTSSSFNPIHTYLDTGWYSVTLISDNPECDSDTLIKANYIHVMPNLPIANFTSGADTICTGDSVQFMDGSTNATTYNWSFVGANPGTSTLQNPVVSYDSSGTYNVTLIASGLGGADTSTQSYTVEVSQMPLAAFTTTDTLLLLPNTTATFTNTSSNADTYIWDFGDGNSAPDINPWHIYNQVGVYTVMLIAQSTFCPDDTLVMDSLVRVETGIGIDDDGPLAGLIISPNPSDQYIDITLSTDLKLDYKLYNSTGQIVRIGRLLKKSQRLNTSDLAPGTYLLHLQNEEVLHTAKLVIYR